jgi:UDPglucose 6-dehydrogenase
VVETNDRLAAIVSDEVDTATHAADADQLRARAMAGTHRQQHGPA